MILRVAERAGLDLISLQREAGVTLPEELGVGSFIPLSAHEALYEVTARHLDDPLLSLRMGELATGDNFDLIAYALQTTDTLWDAALLGKRIHRRFAPHLWFEVEHHDEDWRWVVAAAGKLRDGWPRREIEYLVRASLTSMGEVAARPVPVLEVHFVHPAGGPTAHYERSFGAPARFSQDRTEIVFPAQTAGWRPARRDARLASILERQLTTILGSIPSDGRVSAQARAVIEEKLGTELDERVVASALGLPVRTLQHRLHGEGTSYSAILDDVRRTRALALVAAGHAPIAEISFALGYGDARSFHRAFRRWTGASPAAYRRRSR